MERTTEFAASRGIAFAARRVAALAIAGVVSAGMGGCAAGLSSINTKPAFVGDIAKTTYDGTGDDLLTAGLGRTGLGSATAPAVANPGVPTAAELRRLAIYANYRALVDANAKGGYGTLYGPNVDAEGKDTLGEGKIAGTEYLAYADDGTGTKNVTMMVQVPATFNADRPCIVSAASSGSRGVYGAIGTAGEWGLKRGCAVVYTDKGTGSGVHDLASNTVNVRDGTRAVSTIVRRASNFTAALTPADHLTFNAVHPYRIAVKHAHSQQNPEKDWGSDTLNAIRFAYYVLNEQFAPKGSDGRASVRFNPANTIVIASSVSNGASAAIAAAEQDTEGLIDGVAVSEPNVYVPPNPALRVVRGATTTTGTGKPLYDYVTYANLFAPCASLSARMAGAPGVAAVLPAPAIATNRCTALKENGLLSSTEPGRQAEEALDLLLAYGWQPESIPIIPTHYMLAVPAIAMTYSNTYGRFSVKENLCALSFAATDASGKPAPMTPVQLAQVFGNGNGIPPTATINIVNNASPAGPINSPISVSPSTAKQDYNVDAALCQRQLATGSDENAQRVQAGIKETLRTANLRGKPALIVHGRADALIPVTFSSRPYAGQNRIVEGAASKLSYIEVTNAQHFDAFIDLGATPGYDARFVPLHYYFVQAMDLMWAHLTKSSPLPPSQVVRTTPRGGAGAGVPALTAANVPPIRNAPAPGDAITFAGTTLTIPD
jgi:hydroxybutyrate-dimer hydrolase